MNLLGELQSIVISEERLHSIKKNEFGKTNDMKICISFFTWHITTYHFDNHLFVSSSTSLFLFLLIMVLQHQRWRLHVPVKHQLTFNRLRTVRTLHNHCCEYLKLYCCMYLWKHDCIMYFKHAAAPPHLYCALKTSLLLRSMDWSRWSTILATQISRPRPPPRLLTVQAYERSWGKNWNRCIAASHFGYCNEYNGQS
jgi:hypothetical protein